MTSLQCVTCASETAFIPSIWANFARYMTAGLPAIHRRIHRYELVQIESITNAKLGQGQMMYLRNRKELTQNLLCDLCLRFTKSSVASDNEQITQSLSSLNIWGGLKWSPRCDVTLYCHAKYGQVLAAVKFVAVDYTRYQTRHSLLSWSFPNLRENILAANGPERLQFSNGDAASRPLLSCLDWRATLFIVCWLQWVIKAFQALLRREMDSSWRILTSKSGIKSMNYHMGEEQFRTCISTWI